MVLNLTQTTVIINYLFGNHNDMYLNKKNKQEILSMSKKELSAYLIDITQTDICKDKEYCNFLTQVFLKSK